MLDNFIKGLTILRSAFDADGSHISAEHDQFYVFKTDRPLTPEQVEELIKLRWFQLDVELEDHTVFRAKDYDPTAGWSVYV